MEGFNTMCVINIYVTGIGHVNWKYCLVKLTLTDKNEKPNNTNTFTEKICLVVGMAITWNAFVTKLKQNDHIDNQKCKGL